jgi:hypothetical protein
VTRTPRDVPEERDRAERARALEAVRLRLTREDSWPLLARQLDYVLADAAKRASWRAVLRLPRWHREGHPALALLCGVLDIAVPNAQNAQDVEATASRIRGRLSRLDALDAQDRQDH